MSKTKGNSKRVILVRLDDEDKKRVTKLQKCYGEAAVSKTLLRAVKDAEAFLKFKEEIQKKHVKVYQVPAEIINTATGGWLQ